MTHIKNIPHILNEGFVHSASPKASKDYIPIGDSSLIETRGRKVVLGRPINDYIPFYFGYRSPMLYVIQNGFNGVTKRSPDESEGDIDLKRRKDAEFLFIDEVPSSLISGFIVFNQAAKEQLEMMGISSEKVIIKPDYYY